VAILDLIPLAGATLGAIVVTLVAFTDSTTAAIVVLAFAIVYQQLENHLIQPLVYGRTIALSPLAILVAVLIGAEVAGVVGALTAIPVGGTIQILLSHWLAQRRAVEGDDEDPGEKPAQPPPEATQSSPPKTTQPPPPEATQPPPPETEQPPPPEAAKPAAGVGAGAGDGAGAKSKRKTLAADGSRPAQ
jgi:hypothetical protein